MRSLTLFRHAKTAAAAAGQPDFERQLTDRGRQDAARMGAMLAARRFDLALVSSAKRTVETWEIARGEFPAPPRADISRALYLCGAQKLAARIREIPETERHVLVIGHNPDMHEISLWLASGAENGSVRELRQKFPTASIAVFDIDSADWRSIGPAKATLESFATPGNIDES
jgi:phosphohistidine phosphatase